MVKEKSTRWLLMVSSVTAIAGGLYAVSRVHRPPERLDPPGTVETPVAAVRPIPSSVAPSPAGLPAASRAPASQKDLWAPLAAKYGKSLKPTFAPGGRLTSLRSALGEPGEPAGADFRPDDPQKALQRAREILNDFRELLELRAELPLDEGMAKGNAISAQVFFSETQEGLRLAPYGKITVDLGRKGELLGLDSDYVPGAQVANRVRLTAEEARDLALQAVPDASRAPARGGERLLWMTSPGSVPAETRHAYEYFVNGQRVVVDAENGAILYRRDQREH